MHMIKRIFDIVVAIGVLIFFAPVFAIIAVCIYLTDGTPILFTQKRVGRGGRVFTMYKFRTMTVQKISENGTFDAGDNSRVTGIGRILRKTKLDEFPQFVNVLLGDMSVVGPRPEIKQWTLVYAERWKTVLTVRPGITDNASIIYRDEEEILGRADEPQTAYRDEILPHKLSLYEDYVSRQSLWLDMRIIIATVLVILGKRIEKI